MIQVGKLKSVHDVLDDKRLASSSESQVARQELSGNDTPAQKDSTYSRSLQLDRARAQASLDSEKQERLLAVKRVCGNV